jgi:hypothetical protein
MKHLHLQIEAIPWRVQDELGYVSLFKLYIDGGKGPSVEWYFADVAIDSRAGGLQWLTGHRGVHRSDDGIVHVVEHGR